MIGLDKWRVIFDNLEEEGLQVEVVWLDNGTSKDNNEWCLCNGEDLFERGFLSEEEANKRLKEIEDKLGRQLW